ncbi:MAG: hypothetical protein ABIP35_09925 [Ginsengibacter sp.]
MPAKEIKVLRQEGKLDEAYKMAKTELEAEPDNVWSKRNLSWVFYSQLEASAPNLAAFLVKIEELKQLALPATEDMFWENISIVISKAARAINKELPIDLNRLHRLFDAIKELPIKKSSKWYSVLYSAFHKGMKESNRFIEFANWWGFENFKSEDYQKERMPNGKEVMALVEQAYIAYAKHLLSPEITFEGQGINKEEIVEFIPKIKELEEKHSEYQYPAYFHAKLLLATDDKENMLLTILPFAKKKQNDFWVWEILAEAFSNEPDNEFACYCKALTCYSPETMLVKLRQKIAVMLISKQFFNEAKTEIEILIKTRKENGWKIPSTITNWEGQDWYKNAIANHSNLSFYKQYTSIAEDLLFSDMPEEKVFVDFVNNDRKILNFIASESKFGFFKYDRFFKEIKVGEVLQVRFRQGNKEGLFQINTAKKIIDNNFKTQFFKDVSGKIEIPEGRNFGFIDKVFIHPSIITKRKLENGLSIKGQAIKSYNKEKKQWSWKLI